MESEVKRTTLIIGIITFLDGVASLTATPCSVTGDSTGKTGDYQDRSEDVGRRARTPADFSGIVLSCVLTWTLSRLIFDAFPYEKRRGHARCEIRKVLLRWKQECFPDRRSFQKSQTVHCEGL